MYDSVTTLVVNQIAQLQYFKQVYMHLNIYLEMPQKVGKKVGIHFYENVLSEMNLPLQKKETFLKNQTKVS